MCFDHMLAPMIMLSGCAWRVVRRPAVCCQSSARVHAGASCELHVIISMIIRCVVHDFILAHGLVYVWQSNVPEDTCALGALAQRVTATASKLLAVLPGMISSPCFSVRHYQKPFGFLFRAVDGECI